MKRKYKTSRRILNCIPSSKVEYDWTYENAIGAEITSLPAVLPETVDLREDWWGINDQGSTGSCVGWAMADGLLRWHFVKKGLLDPATLLSVRFIWMSSKETDEFTSQPTSFIDAAGTSLKSALDVARNYGCVVDKLLPFAGGKLFPGDTKQFFSIASKLKIKSYYNFTKSPGDNINDWKQWLADNKGPIAVRLKVDTTWINARKTDGNLDFYDTPVNDAGHAVCIVGYTKDRFIIRNSWGINLWGKDGFGFATYEYARAAFTEAYGIVI